MKLVAILLVLLVAQGSFAATRLPDHKISIQEKNIGLRDLLTTLLKDTNYKYRLSNNVTNIKQISVDVKDTKWSEVFAQVVDQSGLNYRVTSKKRILVSP